MVPLVPSAIAWTCCASAGVNATVALAGRSAGPLPSGIHAVRSAELPPMRRRPPTHASPGAWKQPCNAASTFTYASRTAGVAA